MMIARMALLLAYSVFIVEWYVFGGNSELVIGVVIVAVCTDCE
jgi:hypothetical protein